MGDRANIKIVEDAQTPPLYLYTHWGGTELPLTLRDALAKKWRWDDSPYLVRIIFSEMVKGDEAGETGYGIATSEQDGQDRVLVVNVAEQSVEYDGSTWTFEDYAELSDFEAYDVWGGQ